MDKREFKISFEFWVNKLWKIGQSGKFLN